MYVISVGPLFVDLSVYISVGPLLFVYVIRTAVFGSISFLLLACSLRLACEGPLLLCAGCRVFALLRFRTQTLESLHSSLAFIVRAPVGCLVPCLSVRCHLDSSEEAGSEAVYFMLAVL